MSDGLGNIFDAVEDTSQTPGAKGPDFRVEVEVPRSALGNPQGFAVPVPPEQEIGNGTFKRKVGPGDEADSVRLHLPTDFDGGATLRLRGQGGVADPDGRAGDLYVTVRVVEDPPAAGQWLWLVVIALVVVGGAVWFFVRP
ncbi:MAG: hypothetical protein AAF721_41840 [Myxococcota bacterium]